MKITDKAKGLKDTNLDINDYLENSVDEESAWEELNADLRKIQTENTRIAKEWAEQGEKNLDILMEKGGIERRLQYIFQTKKIEKAAFARQVGMGRTTIQRYTSTKKRTIDNDVGFKSTKKRLLRILDELQISVADFAFEPTDYDKWEAAFNNPTIEGYNILSLRDEVLSAFESNNFVYKHNGETKRFQGRPYELMKSIIESAFKVLDMVPHDEDFFG